MESQIDRRDTLIDGKPIGMLPGTCSNPEPPTSIVELPLGPLDLAWYMLAEAEISSGCDVGILKCLRSRLKDGPILMMEVKLRTRRLTMDVRNSDSASFACHLLDYLAGMEYLRGQDEAAREAFSALGRPGGMCLLCLRWFSSNGGGLGSRCRYSLWHRVGIARRS